MFALLNSIGWRVSSNNREVADSHTAVIFIRVRHVLIVIHWTMSHSPLTYNKSMPYPVRKHLPYGSPQPLYWFGIPIVPAFLRWMLLLWWSLFMMKEPKFKNLFQGKSLKSHRMRSPLPSLSQPSPALQVPICCWVNTGISSAQLMEGDFDPGTSITPTTTPV